MNTRASTISEETADYNKKIRIIDVIKTIGINHQTLKKEFKEIFWHDHLRYYNDLRMKMAKDLLTNQEKRIIEASG